MNSGVIDLDSEDVVFATVIMGAIVTVSGSKCKETLSPFLLLSKIDNSHNHLLVSVFETPMSWISKQYQCLYPLM